jgi:hypothetical protein
MNIHDFLTPDEIEELPADNSLAFAEIARIANERLRDHLRGFNAQEEEHWHEMQEARLGYMNVLIAAGRRLNIEPFASQFVPSVKSFDYREFQQFKSDLDHYLAQIAFDARERGRNESVKLEGAARERIRGYIHALRDCIDKSSLDEPTRAKLLSRLADFESALENRRMKLLAVTLLTLEILALPGALWASADITNRLVSQMMQTVAEAKAVDDASRRLPLSEPPALLEPPRSEDGGFRTVARRPTANAPAFEPGGMDDDIPF